MGNKTERETSIIAVTQAGDPVLIDTNPILYAHDVIEGNNLLDVVTDVKSIPVNVGVYKCDLCWEMVQTSNFDGVEYEFRSHLENVELIIPSVNS